MWGEWDGRRHELGGLCLKLSLLLIGAQGEEGGGDSGLGEVYKRFPFFIITHLYLFLIRIKHN